MKFEIGSTSLLKVYKLMGGFVSKRLTRPILTAIHIVANKENQTVTFESTDTTKIARWIINTNVIENGECSIVFSKKLTYLLKLMKKPIPYYVVIYDEDGVFKANVDGNILVLENCKGDYPNTQSVFEDKIERYENEPIFDIVQLENALKSLRESGATTVKFSIPKDGCKTVKMVCRDFGSKEPIVSYIVTLRDMW